MGKRVPEIFKSEHEYGNTSERTPPYRPEEKPVEFLWARPKGGGGQRYEATGVREYVEQFSAGVEADDLSMVARQCDSAAEGLVVGAPPLLLEDDMAPLDDDADQPG